MKINSINAVLPHSIRQNNKLNESGPESTVTTPIEKQKLFAYRDINFQGVTKLVKPTIESEIGKKVLNKMQFLDRIVPDASKTAKPVRIKNEMGDDILCSLDKTKKGQSVYKMETVNNENPNFIKTKFEGVFDKNGLMTRGVVCDPRYRVSFYKENNNARRITVGLNNIGHTTFRPLKDNPDTWTLVEKQSTARHSFTELNLKTNYKNSPFSELFMKLTNLGSSIKV